MQHQSAKIGQANTGSVALPAVLRAGDSGQAQFSTGAVQKAQHSQVSMQSHVGHMQSTVSAIIIFNNTNLQLFTLTIAISI